MRSFGGGGVSHLNGAGVADGCARKLEHIGIGAAECCGDIALEIRAFDLEVFVHGYVLLGGEGQRAGVDTDGGIGFARAGDGRGVLGRRIAVGVVCHTVHG